MSIEGLNLFTGLSHMSIEGDKPVDRFNPSIDM
jgi:hypothetical protein